MTDPCIRCQTTPASPILWPLCDPCWQDQCNEIEALCEVDDVSRLMAMTGLSFVEAVERLARELGSDVDE